MADPTEPAEEITAQATPPTVTYHHIRSPHFRVIHADGIFGGLVPSGRYVQVSFFSERAAVPDSVRHGVSIEGSRANVGDELPGSRTGRSGIERELEADVRMDIGTASVFYQWLRGYLLKAGVDVKTLEE